MPQLMICGSSFITKVNPPLLFEKLGVYEFMLTFSKFIVLQAM